MDNFQADLLETVMRILPYYVKDIQFYTRGNDNDLTFPQAVVGISNANERHEYHNASSTTCTVAVDVYTTIKDVKTVLNKSYEIKKWLFAVTVAKHYAVKCVDWSSTMMIDTSTQQHLQRNALLFTFKNIDEKGVA